MLYKFILFWLMKLIISIFNVKIIKLKIINYTLANTL